MFSVDNIAVHLEKDAPFVSEPKRVVVTMANFTVYNSVLPYETDEDAVRKAEERCKRQISRAEERYESIILRRTLFGYGSYVSALDATREDLRFLRMQLEKGFLVMSQTEFERLRSNYPVIVVAEHIRLFDHLRSGETVEVAIARAEKKERQKLAYNLSCYENCSPEEGRAALYKRMAGVHRATLEKGFCVMSHAEYMLCNKRRMESEKI